MAIFQQQPIVTDRPFVALQNHSQHVPPYQFQRGGGGGGDPPPPQINSLSIEINSMGGGGNYWLNQSFRGGRGGEGGGVKGPFLWYINSVPWPNQFSTHPYLCKQELQLCSSRARFRDFPEVLGARELGQPAFPVANIMLVSWKWKSVLERF